MDIVKKTTPRKGFTGKLEFLSNMSRLGGVSLCIKKYGHSINARLYFPAVENAYQFYKLPDELRSKKAFGDLYRFADPYNSKTYGKHLPIRKDWDEIRVPVMTELTDLKYPVGSELASWLMEVKDEDLVEYNTWGDIFWGVCDGVGEDNLGKILRKRKQVLLGQLKNETPPTNPG